jgi:uncharacterized damage-inducible protein DinB
MDILDHLLEHDAEATRRQIDLCRNLTDTKWQKTFDFGQGSLYSTFDHLIDSKEYWTSLMLGQPGPFSPAPSDPTYSLENIECRFEAISDTFITISRKLQDEDRLSDTFVDIETGPARRTYGACIVHVATHSMHHRAQVLVMLDLLGVAYDPFAGFALDGYTVN